jgi:hypothetical protein
MQRGRRDVQIVAPRSIIACAKSPGLSAGTSPVTFSRIAGFASGSGASLDVHGQDFGPQFRVILEEENLAAFVKESSS